MKKCLNSRKPRLTKRVAKYHGGKSVVFGRGKTGATLPNLAIKRTTLDIRACFIFLLSFFFASSFRHTNYIKLGGNKSPAGQQLLDLQIWPIHLYDEERKWSGELVERRSTRSGANLSFLWKPLKSPPLTTCTQTPNEEIMTFSEKEKKTRSAQKMDSIITQTGSKWKISFLLVLSPEKTDQIHQKESKKKKANLITSFPIYLSLSLFRTDSSFRYING